jgi:MFS family permease
MDQASPLSSFSRGLIQPFARVKRSFASLNVPSYRTFFLGQLPSSIGDWMQLTAVNVLVLRLGGGGAGLGIVNAATLLPIMILSPQAGVLADRFSKRRILLLCNAFLVVNAAAIGSLLDTHRLTIAWLYLLVLGGGVVNAFNSATRQAFIAEIVPKQQIANGASLYATTLTLSRALGPAAAGLLISTSGLGAVFYANSFSYILILAALARLRAVPVSIAPPIRMLSALRGSFRTAWDIRGYRVPLLLTGIVAGFGITSPVLLPLFVTQSLRSSAVVYSILAAVAGLGTVAGSLFTAARNVSGERFAIIGALVLALTLLVISISPIIAITAIALFISGIAGAASVTSLFAILQVRAEPRSRGALMGIYTLTYTGATALIMSLMGLVAQASTPRIAYDICGAAVLLGVVLILRTGFSASLSRQAVEQDAEESPVN